MYKKLPLVSLLVLLFMSSCEEDPINTTGTAPRIGFAFFVDGAAIKPDSVITNSGKRLFEDSVATYLLPLPVDVSQADFLFYVDSLSTELSVNYSLELEKDVDKIVYKGFNPSATAINLDSLTILCNDTITCTTDEAIINIYF